MTTTTITPELAASPAFQRLVQEAEEADRQAALEARRHAAAELQRLSGQQSEEIAQLDKDGEKLGAKIMAAREALRGAERQLQEHERQRAQVDHLFEREKKQHLAKLKSTIPTAVIEFKEMLDDIQRAIRGRSSSREEAEQQAAIMQAISALKNDISTAESRFDEPEDVDRMVKGWRERLPEGAAKYASEGRRAREAAEAEAERWHRKIAHQL
jgi:hypothetical protein